MKKNLILLSGGIDSVTLLYQFKNEISLAVSFNYGTKQNEKEIEYAKWHCLKLNIKHIIIDLNFIKKYFKSSLLEKNLNKIPKGHYQDPIMKSTVIPFRNGIMLSIAAGLVESNNLKNIMISNHFGDYAVYPDCRKQFIKSMSKTIKDGTDLNIEIFSPYVSFNKREIVLIGVNLNIDYSKTWSCYRGDSKYHCGLCASCVERKEALQEFDNTIYME